MRQPAKNLLRLSVFLCILSIHQDSVAFTTLADRLMAVASSGSIASYVQGCSNSTGGSGNSTISCSLTGVAAGDLLVGCVNWTGGGVITVTDGTSSFLVGPWVSDGNSDYGQCFYLLSANSGSHTYTVTFGGSETYTEMWVMEMHATSGTWRFDTANQGAGASSSSSSGNFTTTNGMGEVIVNDHKLFNLGAGTISPTIGGHTPTEPSWSPIGLYSHDYYLLNTAVTSGSATLTYSSSTDWVNLVMAFYASTATGGTCAGLPANNVQLLSTAVSPGAVNTWPDSSANGNTVTIYGNIPIAGTSDPTPNNKQTVILGGNQYALLPTPLSNSTAYTVCAVYKIYNPTYKNTLTSNPYSTGSFAYSTNETSYGPQGADESYVVGIGQASSPSTTVWTDTCVSYSQGSSLVFYRNGGADPDNVNNNSAGTTAGILQLFSNYSNSETAYMALAELDIITGTAITSAQATAIHNCAVSTWGVP